MSHLPPPPKKRKCNTASPTLITDVIELIHAACQGDLRTVGKFDITCKAHVESARRREKTLDGAIADCMAGVPGAARLLNHLVETTLDVGTPIVIQLRHPSYIAFERHESYRSGGACWIPVEPGLRPARIFPITCGAIIAENEPRGHTLRGVSVHIPAALRHGPRSALRHGHQSILRHNANVQSTRVTECIVNATVPDLPFVNTFTCLRRVSLPLAKDVDFGVFPCLQEVSINEIVPITSIHLLARVLSTLPESVTMVHLTGSVISPLAAVFRFRHRVKLGLLPPIFTDAIADRIRADLATLNASSIGHMVDPWDVMNDHNMPISWDDVRVRDLIATCEEVTTDCPMPVPGSLQFTSLANNWSALRGRKFRVVLGEPPERGDCHGECRCSTPLDATHVRNAAALAKQIGVAHLAFAILSPECGHDDKAFTEAAARAIAEILKVDIPYSIEYTGSSFRWQICAAAGAFLYANIPVALRKYHRALYR